MILGLNLDRMNTFIDWAKSKDNWSTNLELKENRSNG